MKYYVATLIESNHYILNEFDNLNAAYKFYLDDVSKRMIVKEISMEVKEKNV
jgi:hypothetical protein